MAALLIGQVARRPHDVQGQDDRQRRGASVSSRRRLRTSRHRLVHRGHRPCHRPTAARRPWRYTSYPEAHARHRRGPPVMGSATPNSTMTNATVTTMVKAVRRRRDHAQIQGWREEDPGRTGDRDRDLCSRRQERAQAGGQDFHCTSTQAGGRHARSRFHLGRTRRPDAADVTGDRRCGDRRPALRYPGEQAGEMNKPNDIMLAGRRRAGGDACGFARAGQQTDAIRGPIQAVDGSMLTSRPARPAT